MGRRSRSLDDGVKLIERGPRVLGFVENSVLIFFGYEIISSRCYIMKLIEKCLTLGIVTDAFFFSISDYRVQPCIFIVDLQFAFQSYHP